MRKQTRGEEIANSISHGAGLVAAIVATPFLVLHGVHSGNSGYLVGVCIFAATMLLLYLSSTIYHGLPVGRAKHVFLIIEHSAIFFLIAGTYTPFTLGVLHGAWGWTLLALIWGLAATGATLKAFGKMTRPVITTSLYLLMGWLIVVAAHPLYVLMPAAGLLWLVAGGRGLLRSRFPSALRPLHLAPVRHGRHHLPLLRRLLVRRLTNAEKLRTKGRSSDRPFLFLPFMDNTIPINNGMGIAPS